MTLQFNTVASGASYPTIVRSTSAIAMAYVRPIGCVMHLQPNPLVLQIAAKTPKDQRTIFFTILRKKRRPSRIK